MKTETFKKLGDKRLMEEGIAANLGAASGDGALNGGKQRKPNFNELNFKRNSTKWPP